MDVHAKRELVARGQQSVLDELAEIRGELSGQPSKYIINIVSFGMVGYELAKQLIEKYKHSNVIQELRI